MFEALAAAIATALLSTGSAAALAAARRSSETRDAVLRLSGKIEALDSRITTHAGDTRSATEAVNRRIDHLDQRVTALEAGVVNRRHRDP